MRTLTTITLNLVFLFVSSSSWAEIDVVCAATNTPPIVDGVGADPGWSETPSTSIRDAVADIDHEVRCLHTDEQLYFMVRFPDVDENREHKTLIWDADEKRYVIGFQREDTLVFKWNMEPLFTDISLSADEVYKADVWFWKAMRTDHAGFADDKHHIYSDQPLPNGKRLISKSGRRFYLSRRGDKGRSAYKSRTPAVFERERITGFELRSPEGSRADVRARGSWSNGWWTVELARKLSTGNPDDVQFSANHRYQFGLSRYEIAGRAEQPEFQIPLFGSGEVGETLFLILDDKRVAQQ